MSPGMSRRGMLATCFGGAWSRPVEGKSRVVVARDWALRAPGSSPDSGRLLKLLDRARESYFDRDSPAEAWKKVVRPGETIGLKFNCLAGRGASTNPVLVEAICERLQQAGIPQQDIVIWDRLNSGLESAGFRVATRAGWMRSMATTNRGTRASSRLSAAWGAS